jgi:ATP-dependent RNA helicase DDX35
MDKRFWRPGERTRPLPKGTTRSDLKDDFSQSKVNGTASLRDIRIRILYLLETKSSLVVATDVDTSCACQIAQYLVQGGWCEGGLTVSVALPGRVSVLGSVAQISNEMHVSAEEIGGLEVGYSLPFLSRRSVGTKLVLFTNTSLVAAIKTDPLLSHLSVVVVDITVSRPVAADILLGLLRMIQTVRPSLRVVVVTSIADSEDMVSFFEEKNCGVLHVPSVTFQVDIRHCRNPVSSYVSATMDTIKALHHQWKCNGCVPDSTILVFVPGSEEVQKICDLIAEWGITTSSRRSHKKHGSGARHEVSPVEASIYARPLYATLPAPTQMRALEPCEVGRQKVVVATNIAEVSLRVDGVSAVIDVGLEWVRLFDSKSHSYRVVLVPISQSSALRRAKRAGLVRDGQCMRLYTLSAFKELCPPNRAPDILCSDLSEALLILKSVGVDDLASFKFPTPPTSDALAGALSRLHALGAVLPNGRLTESIGSRIAELPLPPHFARALIAGETRSVARQVAAVIAMIEVSQSLFTAGSNRRAAWETFSVGEGDLISLLNIYRGYLDSNRSSSWCKRYDFNAAALIRARNVCKQLLRRLGTISVDPNALALDAGLSIADRVCRAIASGLFANLAFVQPDGKTYRLVSSDMPATIHPQSVLAGRAPRWVVAADVVKTDRILLRNVTVVQPEWLAADVPSVFENLSSSRETNDPPPRSASKRQRRSRDTWVD